MRDFRPARVAINLHLLAWLPPGAYRSALASVFSQLALEENGIAQERASRIVADAWGVQRIGHRIRRNFEETCASLSGQLTFDGEFMLPVPYHPAILRPGGDPAANRRFVHVPPGELLLAVRYVLDRNGAMDRNELEKDVTAMYRCNAVLSARAWLSEILARGVRQGLIALVDHRVQLVR